MILSCFWKTSILVVLISQSH